MHHLEVNVNKYIGQRLDKFIAEKQPEISRSKIKSLIKNGSITVNAAIKDPAYKLILHDKIVIRESIEEGKARTRKQQQQQQHQQQQHKQYIPP